jgi:hypothetical protein
LSCGTSIGGPPGRLPCESAQPRPVFSDDFRVTASVAQVQRRGNSDAFVAKRVPVGAT